MKKRKAAETERKREREVPRAPFRPMNHAYAARACSIINARLIRRSSSTLKIFTKVWPTVNFTERNRKKPVHVWREGMVAIQFAIHPDCRQIQRRAFFPQPCRSVLVTTRYQYDKYRFESRTVIDIFQAAHLFVLAAKGNEVVLCASFGRCI